MFQGLFLSSIILVIPAVVAAYSKGNSLWDLTQFKALVAFGDSYTDESRIGYFGAHNGAAPPTGWIGPVENSTSTGGYVWARYVSWYTNTTLYNYAVGGAVCSNELTPRTYGKNNDQFPSVLEYEVPAFVTDKAYKDPETHTAVLDVPTDETVYSLWIGTNDLGNDAFLTDSQVKGKTIVNYVDCVLASLEKLYSAGARYFVLMNVIPLNYVPQYALPQAGGLKATPFFQDKPSNITAVSYRVMEQVTLVNDAFKYRVPYELLIAKKFPGARFANYDVWGLFNAMYNYPKRYLNGTAPLNVTTWIKQCSDVNSQACVRRASPDSYLWNDALHPSEQADRVVAREFVSVVQGKSDWATYWAS